ncbi:HI1506-related protein [Vibrio alginolyticus]|uniref:HI1506-related protein n=1 Tax=Vibrio alginolyticus TaxID=663 RepID=UPI002160F0D6|nr:HI1506-related protein [Vibrio alginolyticus]MCS0161632.1 HI1506-related protein [Vibrio alginolyticus]MCS0210129.1 HI1506-related protein [Vibrio alginolyticus]
MSEEVKNIIVISAAHDGYRRAGMAFKNGENLLPASQFTEAQLAQIQADPHLRYELHQEDVDGGDASRSVDGVSGGVGLMDAIKQLDLSNEAHFTKSGKPDLKALSAIVGRNVTGAERDEVWTAMQEAADAASGE